MSGAGHRSGADIYRRLLRQGLRGRAGVFALAVFGMAMVAASGPALSALMQPILDGAIVAHEPEVIRWVPLALLGIFALRAAGSYLSAVGMARIGTALVRDLRRRMFARLLDFPAATHDRTASADLLARMTSHVEGVASAASNGLTVLIRDSLTVLGLVGWMLYVSWPLTLAFLLAVPVFAWLIPQSNRRVRRLSHRAMEALARTTRDVQEVLRGYRVVKVFQAEARERQRFAATAAEHRRAQLRTQRATALVSALTMLLVGAAWAGIVYLATVPGVLETITVGSFVSFMFAMLMLLAPARGLVQVNARLQQSIAAGQQVFQLLDMPVEEDRGAVAKRDLREGIEFDRVRLRYRDAAGDALNGVSLTVRRGETVALVGRSGSGKTSLANLLPRFYAPTGGEIRLDGVPLAELRLADLRGLISYVGQEPVLFNDTVRNNITYGVEPGDDRSLQHALRRAHVDEFTARLPQGLETVVGEGGVQLSGGQRQRLALARVLFKHAPILILDEATSALDSESERYVQEALRELQGETTMLVIAHRLSTVERADRIVVLEDGRVVEEGAHAALLAAGGAYAALYRRQFRQAPAAAAPRPRGVLLEEGRTLHQAWSTRLAEAVWYGGAPGAAVLLPLSWLYRAAAALRRFAWRRLLRPRPPAAPVAVVGNLTVGGTGKTPLVVWLAKRLAAHGVAAGVVCRGYRGRSARWPRAVTAATDPREVGEEAVMIALEAGCPVFAGPDRAAAAAALRRAHPVGLILADDGLQHYALARRRELVVIDGRRRWGNGRCLPAGPLREPPARAAAADWRLVHGGAPGPDEGRFDLEARGLAALLDGRELPLERFAGSTVHAVCGIGNPDRFLESLAAAGVSAVPHLYEDHHDFAPEELDFGDGRAVIMTPKDAVKCRRFAREGWYSLEVEVRMDEELARDIVAGLCAVARDAGAADGA